MKTLASLFSVLLATCLLTFVSCSDDDDKNDPPKSSQNKLLPVTLKNEAYKEITTIEYDDLARITKIKFGTYDASNKVTYSSELIIAYDDASPFYTAGSAYIVKSITYRDLDATTGSWVEVVDAFDYALNSTNLFTVGRKGANGSVLYVVLKSSGDILKYQPYGVFVEGPPVNVYGHDSKGNIQTTTHQYDPGDGVVKRTNIYTYDSNKGVFSDVKTPRWLLTQLNIFESGNFNFVNNSTSVSRDTGEGCKLVSKYAYQYNEDGYPILITPSISDLCNTTADVDGRLTSPISIEYKTISEKE